MSRSKHKYLCHSDYGKGSTPFFKNQANRKIRRMRNYSVDGSNYKKYYESWDIFDFKFISWYDNERRDLVIDGLYPSYKAKVRKDMKHIPRKGGYANKYRKLPKKQEEVA